MVQPVEEITDLDEIVVLANDAASVKPTHTFTTFLEEYCGISNVVFLQNRPPTVYLSKTLSVRNSDFYLYGNAERRFKKGIGTKTIPVVKLSDFARTDKSEHMLATNQSTIMSKKGPISQILVGGLNPGFVLVTAYFKEKGKVIFIVQDADKKGDILSDLIPILEEYAAILKEIAGLPPARGVENHIKLKFGSFPKHQINEGITDFGDIFVEETATEHDKSTLLMGFFIGRYSEISVTSEERGKKQFGVRDMNIGKESVLLVESREVLPLLETHVVIKRFDRVLQGWVEGIRSLLMFIAEADAAFLCCKKQTSVQQSSKAALDGNFRTKPLLTISTCVLTQARKKIVHLLLHWLKVRLDSSIWKVEKFLHRKFPPFDPRGRGSFQGGGIVMYRKWVKKKGKSLRKKKKEELGIEVAVDTKKGKRRKEAGLEDELGRLRNGGLNLCYWAVLKDNWAIEV